MSMLNYFITVGGTSRLVDVYIEKLSGDPQTGLVFNSAGLSAYYHKQAASAPVSIPLVTMTVGTWVSGGFKELDPTVMPGWYQLGVPDAVFVLSSLRTVSVQLKGYAGMKESNLLIRLDDDVAGQIAAGVPIGASGITSASFANNSITAAAIAPGAIDAATFAAGAITAAACSVDFVSNIFAYILSGSKSVSQYLRIMAASLAGKSSGGGTSAIVFRDLEDASNEINATVDGNRNRTAVTYGP